MTRVDFYVLPGADPHERRVYACKIAEKAWRQGMKIHLRTGTEAEAEIMDKLLWTFRQGSFIPHERSDAPPAARADIAVLIGPAPAPEDFADLLVNLAQDIPPESPRYARLAEIVDQDETVRAEGRKRYMAYKREGMELETHKLE